MVCTCTKLQEQEKGCTPVCSRKHTQRHQWWPARRQLRYLEFTNTGGEEDSQDLRCFPFSWLPRLFRFHPALGGPAPPLSRSLLTLRRVLAGVHSRFRGNGIVVATEVLSRPQAVYVARSRWRHATGVA